MKVVAIHAAVGSYGQDKAIVHGTSCSTFVQDWQETEAGNPRWV
jgi:hypothetical protein